MGWVQPEALYPLNRPGEAGGRAGASGPLGAQDPGWRTEALILPTSEPLAPQEGAWRSKSGVLLQEAAAAPNRK